MCSVNMSRKRHTVLVKITAFRKFHGGGECWDLVYYWSMQIFEPITSSKLRPNLN